MVDFVKERLNKNEDLKDIIKELLHEIISPDYTKTSKVTANHCYRWCWVR